MKKLRQWLPALLLAVVLDAILVLAHLRAPMVELRINPADVAQREGYAYVVDLRRLMAGWLYEVPTDSRNGELSTLQLFHEGTALGPAHALHEHIRKVGYGTYSHWGNTLYFSMPGNRALAPITLRSASQLSTSITSLAVVVTLLALFACCTTRYRLLFPTLEAQAHTYKAAGVAVALGLLAVFLAMWMTTSPLVIYGADTWGYLQPALAVLKGGDLSSKRTLGYPAFLAAVLYLAGSLAAIAAVQGVLLIGTGLAIIALLWMASRSKAGAGLGLTLLQTFVSLATVAALLAYQPLMNYAHSILPEALYAFLTVLNLLILLAAYHERSAAGLLGLYLAGTLLGTYTYYVKPHWGAAMAFTWIALTVRLFLHVGFGQRLRLPLAVVAPVVAATVSLVLLVLPQRALHERQEVGRLFGPVTLVCVHANLVEPVLHQIDAPADLKERLSKSLRETLDGGPGNYKMLGFDPDYCFYRSSFRKDLHAHFGGDIRAQHDLLMGSFLFAVIKQPVAYVSKVVRQLFRALSHPFPAIARRESALPEDYRTREARMAQIGLPEEWATGVVPRPLSVAPLVDHLATNLLLLADRLAIVVWAAVLAGACLVAVRWLRGSAACGRALATMVLTVGLYFSSTIVVALAHSFDITRYLEALAPLALVAMAICILQLSGALLDCEPVASGETNRGVRSTVLSGWSKVFPSRGTARLHDVQNAIPNVRHYINSYLCR